MSGIRVAVGLQELRRLIAVIFAFTVFVAGIGAMSPAGAQEGSPAKADFHTENSYLILELRLNAEALLTGGGVHENRYRQLRSLDSASLEPLVRDFVLAWKNKLRIEAGVPLDLSYEGARIPVVGDTGTPRISVLVLVADLPDQARSLRLTWPRDSGPVVLRQQGVSAPYTGFLQPGETSPAIPLAGGASLGPWDTFRAYLQMGFDLILPRGTPAILLMLSLFFLSPRLGPLIGQTFALFLASAVALTVGGLEGPVLTADAAAMLTALLAGLLAVENIFVRRLHPWRVPVVLLSGAVLGSGFANVLIAVGMPPATRLPALVGFQAGLCLGMLAVLAAAAATVGLWFRRKHWYRGRIAIPASAGIALFAGYILFGAVLSG